MREDLSDVYEMLVMKGIDVVQKLIAVGKPAENIKHEWVEGELGSSRATLNGAINDSVTTVVVDDGDGQKFRIYTVFKFVNSDELLQVTAISTDTLTVVRGYNGTTAGGHSDGRVIRIISHPVLDNASISTVSRSADVIRSTNYNYVQNFFDFVEVDDVTEASNFAGVKSELAEQLEARLLRFKENIDNLIIAGVRSAGALNSSVTRTMGGLRGYVTGDAVYDASSASISKALINTCLEDIWDNGGTPTHMLVPPAQKIKINSLYDGNLFIERKDTVYGKLINTIETDFGSIDVVMTRAVEDNEAFIVDISRIKRMPMKGLDFAVEPVPRDGTLQRKMVSGHYTMEVFNGNKCFARITNLSTS